MNDKGVEKNDPSFDVKGDINEDKTNNVKKNERSNLDESDDGNLIPVAKEHPDKKEDENKNLDLIEDQTSTKPDISNVSDRLNSKESLPVNSDLENKRSKTNDIESKKKPKKPFFSNLFNKTSSKHNNADETESSRQQLQTIFSNIKSLGLFNLDSYDTMGSATALVTSNNEIITFNNRKDSKFNVNLYTNLKEAAKNSRRNDRLVVIDENFIDNHERIITPLKKEKERQAFISRFVQKNITLVQKILFLPMKYFLLQKRDFMSSIHCFHRKNTKKAQKRWLVNSNVRTSFLSL